MIFTRYTFKKVIFILLNFCIWNNSFGQANYQPFPNDSAVWDIHFHDSGSFPCFIGEEHLFYLEGDSVIGNLTYQKVYKEYININCSPTSGNKQLFFLLRQDISAKRVYMLWNNLDSLLYDFNLHVGDTLPLSYTNPDTIIQKIDYIDSEILKLAGKKK